MKLKIFFALFILFAGTVAFAKSIRFDKAQFYDVIKTGNKESIDEELELVTASGSGLDPDISVQSAKVQVPRIARLRNKSEKELYDLIDKTKTGPFLGVFGPEKINTLKLNVALNMI